MKIVDIRATAVTVPLRRPLRWSFGVEVSTTRTIVELITDEGLVGVGETRGGDEVVQALRLHRDLYVGLDPMEVGRLARRFGVFRMTSEQLALVGAAKLAGAAVEMACWDLVGKALGKRCGDLWGGIGTERVEFAAYVFYRYESMTEIGRGDSPEDAADHAEELFETHGFRDIKFKNGVLPPEQEIASVRLMRERLGDRLRYMRIDPNAVWSVETSIRVLNAVNDYGLEFCEDPTWGIEGMSLVRERTPVPLATNMCCVAFEQIPLAVRQRAVDVILGDVHFWGGPSAVLQLAKICETFNLGLSLHSDRELGISTAAVLHLAAAETMVSHSVDSHLPEQADDIITTPFAFRDGRLDVPSGPGLGVEIDQDKLRFYAAHHAKVGEGSEFADAAQTGFRAKFPRF
ncbi:enolase C-terminal domain-like protein [Phytohabitans flavus]|uniref:glucarate dehydratase n=1 Tax=Phytohabitans flavus TaxID=1076124 RepID=A0A6F8XW07_9ACTN|nr:enolase C-terminal domain-like protein [Phytohabitans flavus]BCB77977.1 mandelate racemase [Phytohabitans flavus]